MTFHGASDRPPFDVIISGAGPVGLFLDALDRRGLLRRISDTDVTLGALHGASTWTDRARQTTAYRNNRVSLAGDAAHDRIKFVSGRARERLGLNAMLIRPDGIVAWACEDAPDDAPDDRSIREAAVRWFGAAAAGAR